MKPKKLAKKLKHAEEKLVWQHQKLAKQKRKLPRKEVEDYTFAGPDGPVKLSSLFGKKKDLIVVHNMGAGLADGITQGNAQGGDWRTAPLWGLGQRLFYLHDGRTSDLTQTITAHASQGSEANAVVNNFQALPAQAQQDILNFLKSL